MKELVVFVVAFTLLSVSVSVHGAEDEAEAGGVDVVAQGTLALDPNDKQDPVALGGKLGGEAVQGDEQESTRLEVAATRAQSTTTTRTAAYKRRLAIHGNEITRAKMAAHCENHIAIGKTVPRFGLCTHGYRDVVSGWFQKDGFWRDCLSLVNLAQTAFDTNAAAASSPDPAAVPQVVEVGGNIGSCALLLGSQGFDVLTFEPLKANYDNLNNSITANGFEEFVKLIAAGASPKEGEARVRAEKGNLGNTIVANKENKLDQLNMSLQAPQTIKLVRLDDHVTSHVHLMKLDCQGSELKALQGGAELLKSHSVDVLQVEFDPILLKALGSHPPDLLAFLWKYKYTVYDGHYSSGMLVNATLEDLGEEPKATPLTEDNLDEFLARVKKHGATDLVALAPAMLKAASGLPEERFLLRAQLVETEEPLKELWKDGRPAIPIFPKGEFKYSAKGRKNPLVKRYS